MIKERHVISAFVIMVVSLRLLLDEKFHESIWTFLLLYLQSLNHGNISTEFFTTNIQQMEESKSPEI